MAHKTRIGGTTYNVSGGRSRINGTGYNIKGGKTLINGTAYNINFLPDKKTLNDSTWSEIRTVSDAGLGSSYWSVGDRKSVSLRGTAGSLSLNSTYYCFIIGFEHNSSIEGSKCIHFQFGKTALTGGTDICFADSGYMSPKTSGSWFNMYNSSSNSGGWKNSRMRNYIIPSFRNCMPSDLRAVLKSITKYSDNIGGGSNTASYVTATSDDIFLLAEFELFGSRTYANSAEQNYQTQYAYYSSGNSKIKYKHNSTTTAAWWWLRSVRADRSMFCQCSQTGSQYYDSTEYSFGFAPGFCV